MSQFDVAIVSHAGLPDGAPDDRLLRSAVERLGGKAVVRAWDDPSVDWSDASVTVVRSTWNYHHALSKWLNWIDAAGQRSILVNAASILRGNARKQYLLALAERGIPIVPTLLIERHDLDDVRRRLGWLGWSDIVVKPAVGASSAGVRRFSLPESHDDVRDHVEALADQGSILIQPFQHEVLQSLERSLVYISGRLSHAFTKPVFHTGTASGPRPERLIAPTDLEMSVARRALGVVTPLPMYARVDLVPTADGPLLMELELTEPDLALWLHPAAAELFAQELLALAKSSSMPSSGNSVL